MTTNGYANNVVAYYNPASNTNFVFNTNLRVNGVNITSDARLKENVESLQNPLALLEQVNGVSYSYNLSTLEENREQDESKFSATLDNGISGSSSDSEEIMDTQFPMQPKLIRIRGSIFSSKHIPTLIRILSKITKC